MSISEILSKELNIPLKLVDNIITLIDDGNTIPFIARYRKEMTGSQDDTTLRNFYDRLNYLRNLDKRREEITNSITEQEKMTDEIMGAIQKAKTLAELEDIYRPYKQKRRTRATIAKEKGLEPLAEIILAQKDTTPINDLAMPFLSEEKEVSTAEDAIAGALDIIAEIISDDANVRKALREYFSKYGVIVSSGDSEVKSVYTMYYDYREPVSKIQGHRVLAVNRGEREDILKVKLDGDMEVALSLICKAFVQGTNELSNLVKDTCKDSFDRLIFPSIEREIRSDLTETASEGAIKIFSLNLKQLLLQPPIRGKTCLAVDPAYRTGCKIAVCDETGLVLDVDVVYPTPPQSKVEEAEKKLTALIKKHNVQIIAIGNGTASKESEIFIANLLAKLKYDDLAYAMVNEAGASVYSASKLASEEFPEYDVSLRSAVSIARRLQDPLSELVKIDPKSIGVGQYQHDMPKNRLDTSLTGVVEDCVNTVGIDLNTASPSLLTYVSGLNATVAKNIVTYREQNGAFATRKQLNKVPRLGPRAYEQCAGFLRIPTSKNILDNTSVHPESYDAAKKLLELLSYSESDVKDGNLSEINDKIKQYGKDKLSEEIGVGVPTLVDIATELAKPGRDIRDSLPAVNLRTDVLDMKDLKKGMELVGTVRNITDFGAFVDVGVHQDGLVHISQISDKFIRHPSEALKVGDVITVYVLDVEVEKSRIALTMKKGNS